MSRSLGPRNPEQQSQVQCPQAYQDAKLSDGILAQTIAGLGQQE